MRFIVFLMILSLGFSGYSAAAHAFADMNAHAGTAAVADMTDCPDHAKKADDHKHEKAKCLDCHHCCSPHVLGVSSFTVNFQTADAVLNPLPVHDYAGEHTLSLLRPPRSLV